jgi:hypothetical protein
MEVLVHTPEIPPSSPLKRYKTPSPKMRAAVKTTPTSPRKRRHARSPSPNILGSPGKRLFPLKTVEEKIRRHSAQTSLTTASNSLSESETKLAKAVSTSRHILFDFTLVEDGIPRCPRTEEEWNVLQNLFPTTYSVSLHGLFLIIRVRTLPPKPWPLSVAGLPFYITTNEWNYPWVRGEYGRGGRILEDLNAQRCVTDEIFDAVTSYFDSHTDAKITAIRWSIGSWRITVPDGTLLQKLPMVVARTPCGYVFESQIQRPVETAYRLNEPSLNTYGDSAYTNPRPSIVQSSSRFGGTASLPVRGKLLATSGVLVKDCRGNEYTTVAGRGYPLGEDRVYHSSSNSIAIADIERCLGHSDIALTRLRPGFSHQNESFKNTTKSRSSALRRIRSPFKLKCPEFLYMDNPFTGYAEGLWIATERLRVPSVPALTWLRREWMWMGQGLVEEPAEGSCGSPVWDEDGNLVLFFRFVISEGPESGQAVGVAATELQKFGIDLT